MADLIDLTLMLDEDPKRVFSAWMDPREHAQFTGGGLATIEPWSGGRFTAFDGEMHGIFLGVDPGARIVQTWRTPEFPPEARDSRLTVTFEAAEGKTRLHIQHADVPPRLLRKLQKGWETNYLKPLSKYFVPGMRGSKKKGATKAPAAASKKPAAAAVPTKPLSRPVKALAKMAMGPVKALAKVAAKAAAATRPAAKKAKLAAPKKAKATAKKPVSKQPAKKSLKNRGRR
jgi:uncharacterized protein YndB with AHSA1/START domain